MKSLRDRVTSFGMALGILKLIEPRPARSGASLSDAAGPEFILQMADRLAALEAAIADLAASIDGQLRHHERRIAALGEEIWSDDPEVRSASERLPSRFEMLELALSQQLQVATSRFEVQTQAGQQIADLLAGLEALSRVYGERLSALQGGIDALTVSMSRK